MIIPQEKIQEIAQANDLVEVINSYVAVKKRGKSYIALCPFHPDKNPSLHISQEKQVYHCFSCKAGGNVFTFVQEIEKVTFSEAAEILAQRAGIDINIKNSSVDLSNELSKLYEINRIAAIFFNSNLYAISGAEKEYVFNYLKKRGLTKEVIRKFGIGYSSNNWDTLKRHFEEENIFLKEDLEKAGLLVKGDNNSYYDRFRGRIIFPVFSENGKVVAFGGRKIYEEDQTGKYINSPESKIYNKSRILYGLNFSKEFIRTSDSVILVEGYMDFISMFEAGVKNVVASSGTSLTEEQVKLISRYTNNIQILFDADLAGIKAAKRGIEIILSQNMDLSVITLPEGEDPDSMIRNFKVEEFNKHAAKSRNIISFISSLYEKENKLKSVQDKTKFVKEIIHYVCLIPDPIKRAFQIKELSVLYGLYESDLITEVNKVLKKNIREHKIKSSLKIPVSKESVNNKSGYPVEQLDRDLLEVFIKGDREALKYIEENIEIVTIKNDALLPVVNKFLDEILNEEKIDIGKVLNTIDNEEIRSLLSEIPNERHLISLEHKLPENSLIVKSEQKKIDYLQFAQDIIRKLKIRHLESEIEKYKNDLSNLDKISEIKREINKLKLNKK